MALNYVIFGAGVAVVFSSNLIVDRLVVIIQNGGRVTRAIVELIFHESAAML